MYKRKDTSPRMNTPGFEHPNNFVLFDEGRDVLVRRIDNDESLTTNVVQYTGTSLSADCTHYSMTIQELPEGEFIMFGITNKCVPGNPMWIIDRSVRYHSNDGGVFNGGLGIKTCHPYTIGDRVTCQLDYIGPDKCLVNFLKNGLLVYRQWVDLPPGQLYPTIGVSRTQAKLRVDWPKKGVGDICIQKELPSNWFGWTGLERDDKPKVISLNQLDMEMTRDAFNIQCPTVISEDFNYYEIEVLKKGENANKSCIAIGLVSGNCEPFVLPGWCQHSLGYHSDDGCLYYNGVNKTEEGCERKPCVEGDRMGCGVIFPEIDKSHFREPILVVVYFTRNGELVYKKRTRQPRGGFFPCVGFVEPGDSVRLEWGSRAPTSCQADLVAALNLADVTADFRCSELIEFTELSPDQAVFSLSTPDGNPQLVQYLGHSLSEVGDGFCLEVIDIEANTELQLGLSSRDHPMEGHFLGSNSTSSGYLLKLGSLAMKDGMRPVSKWKKGEIIICYLDFIDNQMAVLCFEKMLGEMIGRTTVSTINSGPLYASVVMSSGPCTVRMNWSRSIYNSQSLNRDWGEANTWIQPPGIVGEKNRLTLQAADSYSIAACVQCRQPMLTGTSYFSIKLLGGESLPGIGLSKATTELNNTLGSEDGEVCYLPSTGELIMNKHKWHLKDPPAFQQGDILQCGMIFAEADRVHQKGVVYFSINNNVFFHCRFLMAHGGAYPTVTFSSSDCSAEVLQTSHLQPVPENIASEWLNTDTLEGVITYSIKDILGTSGYSSGVLDDFCEEFRVFETATQDRVVYISHSIREKERIDPFIYLLHQHFPNIVFKTSSDCADMAGKQEAIDCSELVVIFMSQLYSESHEMAIEYSLMGGKEIIVAAHERMAWPPGNYFSGNLHFERLPRTFVDTAANRSSAAGLIDLIDHYLDWEESQSLYGGSSVSNGKMSLSSDSNGYVHQKGLHKQLSNTSSTTCLIL